MIRIFLLFLIVILLFSCRGENPSEIKIDGEEELTFVKYSTKFNLIFEKSGTWIVIKEPWKGAGNIYYFAGSEKPKNNSFEYTFIQTPVKSVIPASTTHLPMIEYLGFENTIKGFPNVDYVCSEEIRDRIDKGLIVDVGNETQFNMEKIVEISPQLVIGYVVNSTSSYKPLEKIGIPTLFNADFMEMHPLGRAEWIKVFGVLFNTYEKSDSIFQTIEQNYISTKSMISEPETATAFSGSLYGDSWFMPGGKNYAAQLLIDAGYTYVFDKDTTSSYLQLSFESVYEKAQNAEYWISPAPFNNLSELKRADERYADFTAFNIGNVWCYDKNMGEKGGNNYLELGYLRPDVILKDLIKIHRNELLPEYETVFYRKLK